MTKCTIFPYVVVFGLHIFGLFGLAPPAPILHYYYIRRAEVDDQTGITREWGRGLPPAVAHRLRMDCMCVYQYRHVMSKTTTAVAS